MVDHLEIIGESDKYYEIIIYEEFDNIINCRMVKMPIDVCCSRLKGEFDNLLKKTLIEAHIREDLIRGDLNE